MTLSRIFTHHPFFIRLLNWEYWSFNTIYGPIYPLFVFLCIRSGFKLFVSAANPTIENGGFLMEQKHNVYPLIPEHLYPFFYFVKSGTDAEEVMRLFQHHRFSFPVFAKPNIGMQGKAVKKIMDEDELKAYAQLSTVDYLVQQPSPYQNEVGIFYHRMPGREKGTVSGIVAKEPMIVTGDGKSTLYQLICEQPRYLLQMNALQQMHGAGMQTILQKGEEKLLAPYGNHARGSKFLDWTDKADEAFTTNIDRICKQIPGFYYGRLDVMYNNWNDLKTGDDFHIIELNGAGADPTHIYDPSHSLFFAWKEIIRHWFILWRISKKNHAAGHPYLNISQMRAMFKANNKLVTQLNSIAKNL
jgi:hypothetical protein